MRHTADAKARERERIQLLAERDAADAAGRPLTAEQLDRIASYAAGEIVATWSGQSVDARRDQRMGRLLAGLLVASGIVDAEPGMTEQPTDDGTEFFVVSRSRGRVSIGVLPHRLVRSELADVLPLGRKQASEVGSVSLEARTARRVKRTAELTAEGLAARRIGEQIASEEGEREPFPISTVRTWRRLARRGKP
jgi:hypothetical protein